MVIKEIGWAAEAIEEMQVAADVDRYEKAWLDYLHYLERSWHKLERMPEAMSQHDLSRARQNRKSDPLLSYLRHARNVDQHTIEQVARKHPGGLKISGGTQGGTIHRGSFFGDGRVSNLVSEGALHIEFLPEHMGIVGVTNRGVFYDIPTHHLDIPLNSLVPHDLAQLALDYYKSFVSGSELGPRAG